MSKLRGSYCYFAMKVMDKASLASRKNLLRNSSISRSSVLAVSVTHFETNKFSCLLMEFCSGGDLHTLRQGQPDNHFSEMATRFYATEVLLAME